MKKITFLFISLITGLLIGCSTGTNNEEKQITNEEKKEILRFLMSGIWVNEYNLTAEIDLVQEKPFWKDKYGNINQLEIVAYDLDNLTIIAKENIGKKNEDGVTLRLIRLEDDSYALTWKYDRGKLLFCNFVRKLDRFLD